MKLIQLTVILLIAAAVFSFMTNGEIFHLSRVLPFCSGRGIETPYEIGGLVMLGLFLWGLYRLKRNNRDD